MLPTPIKKTCPSCGKTCRTEFGLCDACIIAGYRKELREAGLADNICESCKKEITEFFVGAFNRLCCKGCADAEWDEFFNSLDDLDDNEPIIYDDDDRDLDLEGYGERRRKQLAEDNEY